MPGSLHSGRDSLRDKNACGSSRVKKCWQTAPENLTLLECGTQEIHNDFENGWLADEDDFPTIGRRHEHPMQLLETTDDGKNEQGLLEQDPRLAK
jgi:hypothetical protein